LGSIIAKLFSTSSMELAGQRSTNVSRPASRFHCGRARCFADLRVVQGEPSLDRIGPKSIDSYLFELTLFEQ